MSVTKRLIKKHSTKKQSANWFKPQVSSGWHKTMPVTKRRELVFKAHKKNALASARSMMALHNITTDKETKKLAHADALYFYNLHNKNK